MLPARNKPLKYRADLEHSFDLFFRKDKGVAISPVIASDFYAPERHEKGTFGYRNYEGRICETVPNGIITNNLIV